MDQEKQILQSVGLTAEEERVYLALLDLGGASSSELVAHVKASPASARRILSALETAGLVTRLAGRRGRFHPTPPSTALEALILQRQEALERTRLSAKELDQRYAAGEAEIDPAGVIEMVSGADAIRQRWLQLEQTVRKELLAFDMPPYMNPPPENPNPQEYERMMRGVRFRIIYAHSALEHPGYLRVIEAFVEAGEEARVLPTLPMKLNIFDRNIALMPFNYEGPGQPSALVVHARTMVTALEVLFEALWARAVPFRAARLGADSVGQVFDPDTVRLLNLVSAGLKDEAIARRLGVARKTVERRLRRLMGRLGAETRFQAGLLVGQRGWGSSATDDT